jgi:hypothetical protein
MRDRYLYLHSPDRIPTIKDFEQHGFDLGVLAPAFAGAMNNKRKANNSPQDSTRVAGGKLESEKINMKLQNSIHIVIFRCSAIRQAVLDRIIPLLKPGRIQHNSR